jgi:hypothetical protein
MVKYIVMVKQKMQILGVILVCIMLILYWHHTPGSYLTAKKLVPKEAMSTIFSSVIGACVVLISFDNECVH